MGFAPKKMQRLAYVARQYYLENRNQSDIAKELGISRPLVSRMLSEARAAGIVEIIIHDPIPSARQLMEQLGQKTSIRGGFLVSDSSDQWLTDQEISRSAFALLEQLEARSLGVGWGAAIGYFADWLEAHPKADSPIAEVFPLVGNASVASRNYHSTENVRLLAKYLGAQPHFLYLPVQAESMADKRLLCSTEVYRQIQSQWNGMDTALLNIGNYPAIPDFSSSADRYDRYGGKLEENMACGRFLAYFFNRTGHIISSPQDFSIQIPLEQLRRCPNVVGLCSDSTTLDALEGALNTGLFTHLVARADLVRQFLEKQ